MYLVAWWECEPDVYRTIKCTGSDYRWVIGAVSFLQKWSIKMLMETGQNVQMPTTAFPAVPRMYSPPTFTDLSLIQHTTKWRIELKEKIIRYTKFAGADNSRARLFGSVTFCRLQFLCSCLRVRVVCGSVESWAIHHPNCQARNKLSQKVSGRLCLMTTWIVLGLTLGIYLQPSHR